MNKIQKIFKSKKGFIQLLGLVFAFPAVSLGIGIFALILILMAWFMLGKILGVIIVIFGLLSLSKLKWPVALTIVAVGLFIFINPFELARLQMMW